jgi:hypothetical protein
MSTGFEVEAAPSRVQWKASGVRLHPEVRRALRAHAALEGVSMPVLLHGILVERLRDRGLLANLSGRERPE